MNFEHNNPFRMNHVGFLPTSKKAFVLDVPMCDTFQVYQSRMDLKFHVVYEGRLQRMQSELPGEWHGDFTHVAEPANYYIQCGEKRSRHFVICDKIYDIPCRAIFNFFTWQRCGHDLGWFGKCHGDDGIIMETGEHRDFTGGHHQSCDLRKSIDGVSIGFIGLIQYALCQTPHWDQGCLADEVKWSIAYFQKLLHPEGFMRDCLFVEAQPGDYWGARYYYDTPAAPSEQWHAIRLQALAARYLRQIGDIRAAEGCVSVARRVWNYMVSDKRRPEPYQTPVPPPYGLNYINRFYTKVYKDSAADISFRLCAAADLFRITGEKKFMEDVVSCANGFCMLQVGDEDVADNPAAACFREAAGMASLAGNTHSYAWSTVGPLCLCEACQLLPAHPDVGRWRKCVENVARQYAIIASRNVWQRLPTGWVTEHESQDPGFSVWLRIDARSRAQLLPGGMVDGQPCYYFYGQFIGTIISHALFLIQAAEILNAPNYREIAQRQIDWILGANLYDASCITGIGYNQLPIPMWTLWPPIPQIPGGVTYGMPAAEYDIPAAGQLMWLLAAISRA